MPTLERLQATGVMAHRRGQGSAWVAAWAAAGIVGSYERGAALAFAQDCTVDYNTVQEWAQGWLLYDFLRANVPNVRELRIIRQSLTLSHFTKLAAVWKRYDLSPDDLWDYLFTAWSEQASVRSMISAAVGENDARDLTPLPVKWSQSILPQLDRLANEIYDNDRRVMRAARLLQARIRQAWPEVE